MQTFLVALVVVVFCVVLMCLTMYFTDEKKHASMEVSSNKEMRKMGIRCAKEEEMKLWGAGKGTPKHPTCSDSTCSDCASCGFYKKEE